MQLSNWTIATSILGAGSIFGAQSALALATIGERDHSGVIYGLGGGATQYEGLRYGDTSGLLLLAWSGRHQR